MPAITRTIAQEPGRLLARALSEGFVYQGEPSKHAGGKKRGEPSKRPAALAFVDFLQNHDQIGNRALGERLTELADTRAVQAAQAILLLSPHMPLLFMGEEWGAPTPFQYFCDFHGRARPSGARGPARASSRPSSPIPRPRCRTRWPRPPSPAPSSTGARSSARLTTSGSSRTRMLLRLRGDQIAPRLLAGEGAQRGCRGPGRAWRARVLAPGRRQPPHAPRLPGCDRDRRGAAGEGHALHFSSDDVTAALERGSLPPWSAAWFLAEA